MSEEIGHFSWEPEQQITEDVSESDSLYPNCVQVFTEDAVKAMTRYVSSLEEDQRRRFESLGRLMSRHNGYRLLPDLEDGPQRLGRVEELFENMSEVISRLSSDLIIGRAMKEPGDFRIGAVLLVGPPGLGKTFFAQSLAESIGTNFFKISASSVQASFQLTGSASQWGNSQPGQIYRVLAEGDYAAPVMIVDEVDKMVEDRFPMTPVLLDLLEPTTARTFEDECLHAVFDASKIVTILTANTTDRVPAPLLSRVDVIEVPVAEPPQRHRIISTEWGKLCTKTNMHISLSTSAAQELAERTDLDLRRLVRVVRDGFAVALSEQREVAILRIPKSTKRTMGFM